MWLPARRFDKGLRPLATHCIDNFCHCRRLKSGSGLIASVSADILWQARDCDQLNRYVAVDIQSPLKKRSTVVEKRNDTIGNDSGLSQRFRRSHEISLHHIFER
jgi:hypothetical protein